MKKIFLLSAFALMLFIGNAQNITLPTPNKQGGQDVLHSIDMRYSHRNFRDGDISLQDLSTVLWAGFGESASGKRTAPTARNMQDIDLYVFLESGVYLWNYKENILELIAQGDYRKETDNPNGFACKVTNIAIVSDLDKYSSVKNNEAMIVYGAMSSAYVSENMYLAVCGAMPHLGTVTRNGAYREKAVRDIMKLKPSQRLFLFQTIGSKK